MRKGSVFNDKSRSENTNPNSKKKPTGNLTQDRDPLLTLALVDNDNDRGKINLETTGQVEIIGKFVEQDDDEQEIFYNASWEKGGRILLC